MNRRNFIKNTAMAAALAGIAPSAAASDLNGGKKKKVIFVLRGVSYSDAEKAIKKAAISEEDTHLQKVVCSNNTFTHREGFSNIFSSQKLRCTITESQNCDRYKFSQLIPGSLLSTDKNLQIIYFHQTEIGHSSTKLYLEKLDEFFSEIAKVHNPKYYKFLVTADIGRNENLNSCGGRDHSNATSLETFAFFMGGNASKLKSNTDPIKQFQILEQKF